MLVTQYYYSVASMRTSVARGTRCGLFSGCRSYARRLNTWLMVKAMLARMLVLQGASRLFGERPVGLWTDQSCSSIERSVMGVGLVLVVNLGMWTRNGQLVTRRLPVHELVNLVPEQAENLRADDRIQVR